VAEALRSRGFELFQERTTDFGQERFHHADVGMRICRAKVSVGALEVSRRVGWETPVLYLHQIHYDFLPDDLLTPLNRSFISIC